MGSQISTSLLSGVHSWMFLPVSSSFVVGSPFPSVSFSSSCCFPSIAAPCIVVSFASACLSWGILGGDFSEGMKKTMTTSTMAMAISVMIR